MTSTAYAWIAIVVAFAVVIACTYGIVKIEQQQRQAFFERYGRWPTSNDYLDGDALQ